MESISDQLVCTTIIMCERILLFNTLKWLMKIYWTAWTTEIQSAKINGLTNSPIDDTRVIKDSHTTFSLSLSPLTFSLAPSPCLCGCVWSMERKAKENVRKNTKHFPLLLMEIVLKMELNYLFTHLFMVLSKEIGNGTDQR